MKNSIQRKLSSYSGLAASIIAIAGNAHGQIIYADPQDIILTPGENYYMDFDQNGEWDFFFEMATYAGNSGGITINNNNSNSFVAEPCCVCFYGYSISALPLNADICGGNLNGSIGANFLCYPMSYSCVDEWSGLNDRYVGFGHETNNNWQFGWIRLSVGPQCNILTIKDWAYNSVPGACISTGQTEVSTTIPDADILSLVIYSANRSLLVKNNYDHHHLQIDIWNTSGGLEHTIQTAAISEAIDLSHFAAGIYLVSVNDGSRGVNQRIFVE
ncbi:MAG: T9SS type A sorting domain-containing protein [Chitinophagales bacterium]